jgi:hypothetical protein
LLRHGTGSPIAWQRMTHKYSIGQLVYFEGTFGRTPAGQYEIVRLLPIERAKKLIYRIKSPAEAFERTAEEHELKVTA